MENGLFSIFFQARWHWLAGGFSVGMLVPLMYYLFNLPMGVSTGYGDAIKSILPGTKPGLDRSAGILGEKPGWRIFFIAGMLAGGMLSGFLSGGTLRAASMYEFTGFIDEPLYFASVYFFSAGFLLGLGSRIAGGCTSGHSIHGIANFHRSSILVTVVFLLSGAVAANILRILFRGGHP